MANKNHDSIAVLGGGPAGAACATVLARAGRRVMLLEREAAPKHKVCGEFLSVEALHLLHGLGVEPAASRAPEVGVVRLASGKRVTEAVLPFPARSLTRLCLDSVLRREAAASGACLRHGCSVEGLLRRHGRWELMLGNGETLECRTVVLATGKHDLRGLQRPRGTQGDLLALKMYLQLRAQQTAALAGAVELLLHPHGYTGLQLTENGEANLCALVSRRRLAHLGGWPGLLAEIRASSTHAAQRLAGAEPLLERPLAIGSIPYGFVRPEAAGPELYAVGDQAAVIPSFTGDGMSLALFTGIRAAQAILRGQSAETFQREIHHLLRSQVRRATVLSRSLVQPALKPFLTAAAGLWPDSLRHVAMLTRLPPQAVADVMKARLHTC